MAETKDHTVAFESALELVNIICGWILLASVAVSLLNVALLVLQHLSGRKLRMVLAVTQPHDSPLSLDRVKLELGRLLAFSLLLLVAADVLETLMKPMHHVEMTELYKLAMVGAIRTTLAYFLGKEIEEIMHHVEHADGNGGGDNKSHHQGESEEKVAVPVDKKKTKKS